MLWQKPLYTRTSSLETVPLLNSVLGCAVNGKHEVQGGAEQGDHEPEGGDRPGGVLQWVALHSGERDRGEPDRRNLYSECGERLGAEELRENEPRRDSHLVLQPLYIQK